MYQVGISDRRNMEILLRISDKIKKVISKIDIESFKTILTSHYRTLNLINSDGKWMTDRLNNLSDILIPEEIEHNSFDIFIDEITMLCTRNNYLMNFLNECNKKNEMLKKKFNTEGERVIIDIAIYAYMIETLSKECTKDYLVLEELYHCFSVNRNKVKSFKELPLFNQLELLSVESLIRKYLKCHKKKTVNKKFGRIAITRNIIQVSLMELLGGRVGNAKAGFVLAMNNCGLEEKEKSTGAGPTLWSKDEKIIEHAFPLSESWDNLYQVWSMCFAMQFKDSPYALASLLIPQVANYHTNSNRYIYNMNIALYIYLNFASFNYANKKKYRETILDWRDKGLRKSFSYSNKKSARLYKEKLKRARE